MSLRVRIDHGQDAGKVWRLAKEGSYGLGRLPSADIQVLDMKVSKDHCRIVVQGSGSQVKAVLVDLESTHGTLVNGQPVNGRVPLKPGDEIRLGLSILRVLSDGEADVELTPSGNGDQGGSVTTEDAAAGTPEKRQRVLPPDELVGQEIGGYKVLQKIGQGGMGSVYTAEQLSLHREVALKVLNQKLTVDRGFIDQFVNEARSAAALNHPNVVQVYDVGRQNGRYYFSMEYVPGGSLEERLAEDGAADWRPSLNWLIDASNALIFAQTRDILHRDVKPDNLMLAEDGSAKLCDLGLAKKAANPDMLAAGIIGTPAFISPEAIRRRKEIDVRSDLYSLGCTFYRVLTGENPYPAKTVKEILVGHLKSPVPRVSDKKPAVPREIDDVVYKLMQKEPADRYQAPQELLQDLDRIRTQHGLEKHGLRPGSRKPLIIALAVVVLLGAAGLLFLLTRPKPVDQEALERARIAAAERDRAEREKAELAYTNFVSGKKSEKDGLLVRKASGNLRQVDNWKDPSWATLADEFQQLSDDLRDHEAYGKRDEVLAISANALREAKEIREYLKVRRETEKVIQEAQDRDFSAFRDAIGGMRQAYDAAAARRDWPAAWVAVLPAAITKLVEKYTGIKVKDVLPVDTPAETKAKFEDDPLLDPEKHVKPVLEELLPGEPPGEALRAAVLKTVQTMHATEMGAARKAMEGKAHEGYADAIRLLEAYLEKLPSAPDPKAGEVAKAILAYRKEAEALKKSAESADAALLYEDVLRDKDEYVKLLKALRAPKDGFFYRFRFSAAASVASGTAEAMRYRGYRALAEELAEDAGAMQNLLERAASTFAEGWAKDRVEWTDDRGRAELVKVKDVTADGVKLGSETYSWSDLGPRWILSHLLHTKEGEPRFAFTGDDHRGLAVLGEMGALYDVAGKHYQLYLKDLSPDAARSQKEIRQRMGRLALERGVAEAWTAAQDNFRWIRRTLDLHDDELIGVAAFWEGEEHRESLKAAKAEIHQRIQKAWEALGTLQDAKFNPTVWITVLRAKPPAGVRYANESPMVKPVDDKDE